MNATTRLHDFILTQKDRSGSTSLRDILPIINDVMYLVGNIQGMEADIVSSVILPNLFYGSLSLVGISTGQQYVDIFMFVVIKLLANLKSNSSLVVQDQNGNVSAMEPHLLSKRKRMQTCSLR